MRGRKPKPFERQISEGDPAKRGKHKLDQKLREQVKATSGLPKCPAHLHGRARSVWNLWAEELEVMNLSKRPDAPMLEGACRAYERAVKADLILDREGLTFAETYIDDDTKEAIVLKIRKHPAVEISNRSWLIVKAFGSEFGLSPVSRTRLTIQPDGEKPDDMAALLSSPRAPRQPMMVQ